MRRSCKRTTKAERQDLQTKPRIACVDGVAASMPDTIDIDGVRRSTWNSIGKRIAPTEEQVRTFWNWFGASQVVDDLGRPNVVYHGTNHDFTVFKKGEKDGLSGKGIYFSKYPLPQCGNRQISAYLKIERPIKRNTEKTGMREINSAGIPTKMIPDVFDKFPEFDGIMNRMEIVVKDPMQIAIYAIDVYSCEER